MAFEDGLLLGAILDAFSRRNSRQGKVRPSDVSGFQRGYAAWVVPRCQDERASVALDLLNLQH